MTLELISSCFQRLGAAVLPLEGDSSPNLLISFRGFNVLIFVKSDDEPSRRRLLAEERRWTSEWNGPIFVVETEEHVTKLMHLIETYCPVSPLSGFSVIEHMRSSGKKP